jgi:hypothetical protein
MSEEIKTLPARPGYDRLWLWFELSRAGWLVIPRVLLHEMPDEWQGKMADLMEEYERAFPNQPDVTTHVSIKEGGRFTPMFRWLNNYRYPARYKIEDMKRTPEQKQLKVEGAE